jgi:hypothetical protein
MKYIGTAGDPLPERGLVSLLAPAAQPKMWDTLSPKGEGILPNIAAQVP